LERSKNWGGDRIKEKIKSCGHLGVEGDAEGGCPGEKKIIERRMKALHEKQVGVRLHNSRKEKGKVESETGNPAREERKTNKKCPSNSGPAKKKVKTAGGKVGTSKKKRPHAQKTKVIEREGGASPGGVKASQGKKTGGKKP